MSRRFALSVDCEVFGDGGGCLDACVTSPLVRMAEIADAHGARLTMFIEALHLAALESVGGRADLRRFRSEVAGLAAAGHELQLHLHPQLSPGVSSWRIGDLEPEEVGACFDRGLAALAASVPAGDSGAHLSVFRAGGWCIQPSGPTLRCVVDRGFVADSSVAPGLTGGSPETWFDFSEFPPCGASWVDESLAPVSSPGATTGAGLLELPIATRRSSRVGMVLRRLGRARAGITPAGCVGDTRPPDGWSGRLRGRALSVLSGRVMLDHSTMVADDLIAGSDAWLADHARTSDLDPRLVTTSSHTKTFGDHSAIQFASALAQLVEEGTEFVTLGEVAREHSNRRRADG